MSPTPDTPGPGDSPKGDKTEDWGAAADGRTKAKIENWGTPEERARVEVQTLHLRNLHQRFLKLHQLTVLAALLASVIVLIVVDHAWQTHYVKELLPILLPIFTFMIGMQSRGKSD